MQLAHLKQQTCSDCGARTRSAEQEERPHCNGQWFETRTFHCGAQIKWVPNFNRQEQTRYCEHNPATKQMRTWQKNILTKVKGYVGRLKCPEDADVETFNEFKDKILEYVNRVNPDGTKPYWF